MKKTVALALGSGGARGYAHIGFIRALKEHDYEIVKISGSSMGAIVGSLYCAGKLDEFEDWVCSLKHFDILRLLDISPLSSSVIRGDRIFTQLESILGDTQIEELPIPFTAVATDLIRRKEVWFQSGSLIQAVRASSAIPSVFAPVIMGKRYLVDGGVMNPVPIIPCSSANAEHVFAVDLNGETPMPEPQGIKDVEEIKTKPKFSVAAKLKQRIKAEEPDDLAATLDATVTNSQDIEVTSELSQPLLKTSVGDALELNTQTNTEPVESKTQPETTANVLPTDNEASRFDWFNQIANRATSWLEDNHIISSKEAASKEAEEGIDALGKLETLSQIMEVMQASITQYKTAGYPPDMLVKMPASACQTYEFYRAKEVIELGYEIGKQAIESYEKGNSSTYGQLW